MKYYKIVLDAFSHNKIPVHLLKKSIHSAGENTFILKCVKKKKKGASHCHRRTMFAFMVPERTLKHPNNLSVFIVKKGC